MKMRKSGWINVSIQYDNKDIKKVLLDVMYWASIMCVYVYVLHNVHVVLWIAQVEWWSVACLSEMVSLTW